MGIFYLPMLILLPAAIIFFICRTLKTAVPSPEKQKKGLDRVGMVTNILLALLYLPLSIFGSLSGMVSDGFLNGTGPQLFLCDLIGIFGFCTPLAAFGGLFLSVKLRSSGRSLQGFLWQFAGMAYLLFIFGLTAILFAL